jgi:catechol 2,3-dioxygenase-like lactoylglutathione lyase family enzyme
MAIEIRGVAPLVQVFSMPRSIRFYRDVLGFEVTGRSASMSDDPDDVNWCMLELGGACVMLNTAYDPDDVPDAPDAARWSGHQDTGLFFACPDVDGAYRHLVEKGVEVNPPKVAWYGMKQLYLTDPDGFGVCFQWTASDEERAAAMAARGAS